MQAKMMFHMLDIDKACAERCFRMWDKMCMHSLRNQSQDFRNMDEYMAFRVIDVGGEFTESFLCWGMGIQIPREEDVELSKSRAQRRLEVREIDQTLAALDPEQRLMLDLLNNADANRRQTILELLELVDLLLEPALAILCRLAHVGKLLDGIVKLGLQLAALDLDAGQEVVEILKIGRRLKFIVQIVLEPDIGLHGLRSGQRRGRHGCLM